MSVHLNPASGAVGAIPSNSSGGANVGVAAPHARASDEAERMPPRSDLLPNEAGVPRQNDMDPKTEDKLTDYIIQQYVRQIQSQQKTQEKKQAQRKEEKNEEEAEEGEN